MELEIGLTLVLLIVLSLLATVDMAFAQLSDVGLRRLMGENGDKPERPSKPFLRLALEHRPRFSFASAFRQTERKTSCATSATS